MNAVEIAVLAVVCAALGGLLVISQRRRWPMERALLAGVVSRPSARRSAPTPTACTIHCYLALSVTPQQRRLMEEQLREAAQASPHWALQRPLRLRLEQQRDAVALTLTAYAASADQCDELISDVTRAALDLAAEQSIPLATTLGGQAPSPRPAATTTLARPPAATLM